VQTSNAYSHHLPKLHLLDSFPFSKCKILSLWKDRNLGKTKKTSMQIAKTIYMDFTIHYIAWKENEVKNTLSKRNLIGSKIRNFSFKVGGSSIWF
jgi:hypothetical protein